jgi:hypothetical protein
MQISLYSSWVDLWKHGLQHWHNFGFLDCTKLGVSSICSCNGGMGLGRNLDIKFFVDVVRDNN